MVIEGDLCTHNGCSDVECPVRGRYGGLGLGHGVPVMNNAIVQLCVAILKNKINSENLLAQRPWGLNEKIELSGYLS